jgi:PiT family inorganic phosphate transporter
VPEPAESAYDETEWLPLASGGRDALLIAIAVTGLLLAFANGANDNFKGVATLYGSGTSSYRSALWWATATTALGSIAAVILARGLLDAFAGKGLVPPEVAANPVFPASVALAAGTTVLLASRIGLPISTTHALLGGLLGSGLALSPTGVDIATLSTGFAIPLLSSPVIAFLLTAALYQALRRRPASPVLASASIGGREATFGPMVSLRASPVTSEVAAPSTGPASPASRPVDIAHLLSAGVVSFARGLNDTPKIAAVLLVGGMFSPTIAIVAVGAVIAIGGLLCARRVAGTMSHDVTAMNAKQGFVSNIVTSTLVIGAANMGLPVSTTHVSCGALFGMGAATRQARWHTIGRIVLAWLVTLPIAGVVAAVTALGLSGF